MKQKFYYPNWLFKGTPFENKTLRRKLEKRNLKAISKNPLITSDHKTY
jgi:hypothetical protein